MFVNFQSSKSLLRGLANLVNQFHVITKKGQKKSHKAKKKTAIIQLNLLGELIKVDTSKRNS